MSTLSLIVVSLSRVCEENDVEIQWLFFFLLEFCRPPQNRFQLNL